MDVYADENKILKGISFQTQEMRSSFSAYPELVLIDATYKLNDLRMPLYVLQILDGNGQAEIICFWLVASEDQSTISFMMDAFKKRNDCWPKVQVIMADKDMTERDVLCEKLPSADILICLFHTLRSFRREISMEKMGISAAERTVSLELLQKIAYSRSEEEYALHYDHFKNVVPRSVAEYFDKNWHGVRHEWVEGLKSQKINFLNNTNNRLESTNQKLKSVISRYSGITTFFKDLIKCVSSLKNERDHRAARLTLKVPICRGHSANGLIEYQKFLTPFAFEHLQKQIESFTKINVLEKLSASSAVVKSKSLGDVEVHCDSCPCAFFSSMRLPCKHIFSVRNYLKLPLYDESLCATRWTLHYYKTNHRIYGSLESSESNNYYNDDEAVTTELENCKRKRTLTEQQKYRKAHDVLVSIAQIISEQGQTEFDYSMQVLTTLRDYLQERRNVVVAELIQDTGTVKYLNLSMPKQDNSTRKTRREQTRRKTNSPQNKLRRTNNKGII